MLLPGYINKNYLGLLVSVLFLSVEIPANAQTAAGGDEQPEYEQIRPAIVENETIQEDTVNTEPEISSPSSPEYQPHSVPDTDAQETADNTTSESTPDDLEDSAIEPPFLLDTQDEPAKDSDSGELVTTDNMDNSDQPDVPEQTEPEIPPLYNYLDEHERLISSYLHRFVTGVDNFFTNDDTIDETSGSYMRLTTAMIWPEKEGAELDLGLSLKIRLPKTQRKLRLTFESSADETTGLIDKETREEGTTESTTGEKSYYTGLESELRQFKTWKIRPSVGVKIRSPLELYVRLRATREVEFENWFLYFNETLFWFDETGYGSDTTMRWDRKLSNNVLFRSNSFARYTEDLELFEMSQTFSLIHTLSQKRAITYKAGMFGESEPSVHATAYLLSAQYRNNLHSDYLFLDIQPQIIFEQENDFKGELEFLIRLELFYRD